MNLPKLDLRLNPATCLNAIEHRLFVSLINSQKVSALVVLSITLLEEFAYQLSRLDRLDYCDYESAYISYRLAYSLYNHSVSCDSLLPRTRNTILPRIKQTLSAKKPRYEYIRDFISNHSPLAPPSSDPLLARLNKLKTTTDVDLPPINLDMLVAAESVLPHQLHQLLYDSDYSILIVDYRPARDFSAGHLKADNIVNIDPAVVDSLTLDATDADLEISLKASMSPEMFLVFQNRCKYDMLVLYDEQFGESHVKSRDCVKLETDSHMDTTFGSDSIKSDRPLDILSQIILNDPTHLAHDNPFKKFVNIILHRNKYLSSRLKRAPCYLRGGFAAYRAVMENSTIDVSGVNALQEFLDRGSQALPDLKQEANDVFSFDQGSDSKIYVKSFDGYLATAKRLPKSTEVAASLSNRSISLPRLNQHAADASIYGSEKENKSGDRINGHRKVTSSDAILYKRDMANGSSDAHYASANEHAITRKAGQNAFPHHVTGLVNLGNSCYMNCIVQCLAATPPLVRFFIPSTGSQNSKSYQNHINMENQLGTKGILTSTFANFLASMIKHHKSTFSPYEFKRIVGGLSPGKQFAGFDQQDCIEFLNFLLDGLHEDLNKRRITDARQKKAIVELTSQEEQVREALPIRLAATIEWERYLKLNLSIIVDYFQGQYLLRLKCIECGLTSTTFNAFSTLSLPIPQKLDKGAVLLQDCLREFTQTELLDADNRWHCPRCCRFTKLTKTISITRLPQILVIHFKRFHIMRSGQFQKLETFVSYPVAQQLDLGRYLPKVGSFLDAEATVPRMLVQEETRLMNGFPPRNQMGPFKYQLYAVANHFGNLSTGHYTLYVKKPGHGIDIGAKSPGWCYFNDSRVTTECPESQVLNRNAYCLFYQRVT